ncbi:MAG: uroporphyrinogen methyltransferase / synthase [Chloroflexota bacterium]|nr:uroporphyrinogen methyltransferase / synthase [Chloroflexota bacterium]
MSRSLVGITVLVTRPPDQASRLAQALRAEGARALEVPAIAIEPPESWEAADWAIAHGGYDWAVFTSANGVRFFLDRLATTHSPSDWFRATRLAAIGPATTRALADAGLKVDLMPDEFVAEALVACLLDAGDLTARRILLPRGNIARETLSRELLRAGALVDAPVVYRTVSARAPAGLREQLDGGAIDAATFTSSSSVRGLLEMMDSDVAALRRLAIACIGPVTAATVHELGLEPAIIAETATIDGLVRALCTHYATVSARGDTK